MVEDIGKTAEKYIQEMKRATAEAQKGLEKAALEMDRLGKMMYEDVRSSVQGPGNMLNNIKDKMAQDIDRELPHMVEQMHRLEGRMERYIQDMQEEVGRITKK
jgi:hypothetical protein